VNTILDMIYSAEFAVGALCGAASMKLYQWWYCRHLDHVRPLPGGGHRHMPGVNLQMLGGLLAVLALGYVLFQTQSTEDRYKGLAERWSRCQVIYQADIAARNAVEAENDKLSIIRSDKLTELDGLTAQWIYRLLNPPPHLAGTSLSDPGRQGYTLTVTRIYQEQAAPLRADIAKLRDQASQLLSDRADKPIPYPACD